MLFDRLGQVQEENMLEPYEFALYEQLMVASTEDELYANAKALRSEVNDALARLEKMINPYLVDYACKQERNGRYFDEYEWMWIDEPEEVYEEDSNEREKDHYCEQAEGMGRGRA